MPRLSAEPDSTQIVRKNDPVALAAAVELNHVESIRLEGKLLPWVKFYDDGDVLRLFAGDTWPANTVCNARFTPQTASGRIREILAKHTKEKVACNWVVGPVSQPVDLGKYLSEHGFSCRIHCAGMASDLTNPAQKPPVPENVTIEQLDEPPGLFPLTTERRRNAHRSLLLHVKSEPRRLWHFVATFSGKAVGETTIITGAGVAGVFGVNVLENFRGRGIGTALVFAALEHARSLGLSTAVLGATGMGKRIYERLGFREVCKLSFWKYGKMRQL